MSETFCSLPDDIAEKYKCCFCGLLLSVPPITLMSIKNETFRCGRCVSVKVNVNIRMSVYENVAQFLAFPCSYAGCKMKLPWGKVLGHETNCPHRTIKCPLPYYYKCSSVFSVQDVRNHFNDKHKFSVKTVGEVWHANVNSDYVYFMKADEDQFFVYIRHQMRKIQVDVLAIGHTRYKKFRVSLSSFEEHDRFTTVFKECPIVPYDERVHCLSCLKRGCNELHHPFAKQYNHIFVYMGGNFVLNFKPELARLLKDANGVLRYVGYFYHVEDLQNYLLGTL
ncbi:hypothetical protein NQ315_007246 [Exocentrus adspersus]|uniref:SIAH-type domain-containing protein n=1 Tax=Exocentrus adspersus TaxID=1586481 RepID=A0AAV8WD50_9CUCU|nr:hypothetical protein NQ315_007246 [Exocentrus adspersus]